MSEGILRFIILISFNYVFLELIILFSVYSFHFMSNSYETEHCIRKAVRRLMKPLRFQLGYGNGALLL